MSLTVKTTKGTFPLDATKISQSLEFAATGLSKVNLNTVYDQVVRSLYDGITTDEIITLTIKTSAGYIGNHYEYSYLTARLMLQKLYKEIFGGSVYEQENFYSELYVAKFDEYLDYGVGIGLMDPMLKTFDLEKIKAAIKPERDLLFKEVGMGRIIKQYLLKTNTEPQTTFELPQFWMMRVAMGMAKMEKNKTEKAIEFYETLSTLDVLSSTPTLLNSGRVRNQCSSCFLTYVEDSLEGIMEGISDVAYLSKYAGGLGVDWGSVRATGSLIKGTNGKSLGIVPFLKTLDSLSAAVNQGGVRKGAVMASIEPWHADIRDFIAIKSVQVEENRRAPNLHTALWIPDLFMKRVEAQVDWTLFSPSDVPDLHEKYGKEFEAAYEKYELDETIPQKKIKAEELWREILVHLLGKGFGHPWITFKDSCNVRSPQDHVGVIHSTNLCTEVALNTSREETAVCNLASINLSKFVLSKPHASEVVSGEIDPIEAVDWEKLKRAIYMSIRMLDNVIDSNFYATPQAEYANKRHRPVGLGVMGYQDMIQQLNIAFSSQESVEFSDKLFEFISYYSIEASSELAAEKGVYSTYKGSKWDRGLFPLDTLKMYEEERGVKIDTDFTSRLDWDTLKSKVKQYGMRNSQLLAIAPTRSISYIGGTSPSIEPWDSNIFTEVGMTGKYTMINDRLLDALEEAGIWSDKIMNKIKDNGGSVQGISEVPTWIQEAYKTAYEVHPRFNIAANARRQKWVDMAISFNQWLPSTNGKDAEKIYMECWKAGLKSTYYLHTRSGSMSEKMGSGTTTIDAQEPEIKPEIKIMANGEVCDRTDPNCEACQ